MLVHTSCVFCAVFSALGTVDRGSLSAVEAVHFFGPLAVSRKVFSVGRVRLATEIDGWIGFSLSSFSSARRRMVRLIWAVSSLQWKRRWRYTLKHEQIGIC